MIKKIHLLILLSLITYSSTIAQTTRFNLGIVAMNHSRPDFNKYTEYLLQSLNFATKPFNNTYGVDATISTKLEHAEISFGGTYTQSRRFNENSENTIAVLLKQKIFDIHLGLDYYPIQWFFVGAHFYTTSFNGDFKYENNGPQQAIDTLIDFTDDSFNIFKGYSIGMRAQSGINIPITPMGFNGAALKISGNYDFGLTPYKYYESFDKVLLTYTENKKTKGNRVGIQIGISFPI